MSFYDHYTETELEILRDRARRISRPSDDREGQLSAALEVEIHEESYALPVEELAAVYENTAVIPVPSAPPLVAGIANIRGHIIPVLNPGVLLGVSSNSTSSAGSLVVISNDELTVAFRVEAVGDVTPFSAGDLSPLPANFDQKQSAYIQGILPNDAALLDVDAILNDPALVMNKSGKEQNEY